MAVQLPAGLRIMRIKVGDEVEVISGNDKGVRGTVQRILQTENRLVVSGLNIVKKHQKPRQTGGRAPAALLNLRRPLMHPM